MHMWQTFSSFYVKIIIHDLIPRAFVLTVTERHLLINNHNNSKQYAKLEMLHRSAVHAESDVSIGFFDGITEHRCLLKPLGLCHS